MKIRVVLPAVISVLALLLMLVAGEIALKALERRVETTAFLKASHTTGLLLASGGAWAVERGLSATAMKSETAISPAIRADIEKERGMADAAFREALTEIRDAHEMSRSQQVVADAEKAFSLVREMRVRIDENFRFPDLDRV